MDAFWVLIAIVAVWFLVGRLVPPGMGLG